MNTLEYEGTIISINKVEGKSETVVGLKFNIQTEGDFPESLKICSSKNSLHLRKLSNFLEVAKNDIHVKVKALGIKQIPYRDKNIYEDDLVYRTVIVTIDDKEFRF